MPIQATTTRATPDQVLAAYNGRFDTRGGGSAFKTSDQAARVARRELGGRKPGATISFLVDEPGVEALCFVTFEVVA